MYIASIGNTAPFIVIETDILSNGIPSNKTFMSSTESIGTPSIIIIIAHDNVLQPKQSNLPCLHLQQHEDGLSHTHDASPNQKQHLALADLLLNSFDKKN